MLGVYDNNKISTETEVIDARAYASRKSLWHNRYGFWLLKLNEGWNFWVICEYVEA